MGVLGIIYNPILEEMFTAKKGGGAYLNGEKIEASGQKGECFGGLGGWREVEGCFGGWRCFLGV